MSSQSIQPERASSIQMKNLRVFLCLIVALGIFMPSAQTSPDDGILRLATTTSTENSGLIDKLIPKFSDRFGVSVHTIAGGTGRALNHARNGDVDVVLVHAKKAELELVASGHGVYRREIMYNEFVIVGPESDPAGIGGLDQLGDAFRKIAQSESSFISRGDDSGTHKRELEIWIEAGLDPMGEWYKEVGLGMGRALQIADELRAYTLTDKGTWLALQERLSLPVHVEGAPDGRNIYGIIAVNPERHPQVNFSAARNLIDWMQSDEAQAIIARHRVNNEQLFYIIE